MSKIIGISTSFNINSKSKAILEAIKTDLKDDLVLIDLKNDFESEIFCEGCKRCIATGSCYKEQNRKLINELIHSEIIILAFPIYFGSISGKSKSLLESFYCLKNNELENKKVVVILSAEKEGQEGIAVLEILPWAFKHKVKLTSIEVVNDTLTIDDKKLLLERLKQNVIEDNNSEMRIQFGKLKYFNKIVDIPIEFDV